MNQLLEGLSVAALGMLVVFSGLVILILCINVISRLSKLSESKTEKQKDVPAPVAAPIVETGLSEEEDPSALAPEILAAITAAIAAVWQGETGFTVRHVRRVNNAPVWNRAGREEQTYSHF